MIFSSTIFIFLFLPIVLVVYFLIAKKFRNFFILLSSLFFYAWGEYTLVFLMIGSICVNYIIGNIITEFQKGKNENVTKIALFFGVVINLIVLGYYKYIYFFLNTLSEIGFNIDIDVSNVTLPIGISFFTFQSISYLIDVYRKTVPGQKSLINLGMYISLFPQLIAGPIVRYADISKEIENRKISASLFKDGITRFITGFAKKILIANNVGLIANKVFEITPYEALSTSLAWIGIICYTLQIYYDFSGYSDMAIGLGKMFGFNFRENFNYPYISTSIKEFWRRWHISLSSWFKDYLYIPLGGNQKGEYRTYINLIIVFILTGLWHGARWNFVVWGLFHGFFLVIERLDIIKIPSKYNFLSRFYLLLVVTIGWVFFRVENLNDAIIFIEKMVSFSGGSENYPYIYLNNYVGITILSGIVFSIPIQKYLSVKTRFLVKYPIVFNSIKSTILIVLFLLSILELAQTTYNPFIYFRF